jgi:uncharacterized protein (TIGR03086 family)
MSTPAQTSDAVRVLVHALDQAADELDHVHPDDLGRSTPCRDWDVATLADHLVAAPAKFVTMMRGEEPDWSAPPPHVTSGWAAEFRVHADDLAHAWHALDGDPPVPPAWQVAELAVHTWDLATALGRPTGRLDPEVAEVALGFMRASLKPEMRDPAFGPEQQAPAGSGPYETLAAFAGRAAE